MTIGQQKPQKPAPFDRAKEARELAAWARRVPCPACIGLPATVVVRCAVCGALGTVDPQEQLGISFREAFRRGDL